MKDMLCIILLILTAIFFTVTAIASTFAANKRPRESDWIGGYTNSEFRNVAWIWTAVYWFIVYACLKYT